MPDLWMDVDIALSEVPVNIMPLLDDTDFKTRETAVAYNAAGMDLVWNFVTTGGSFTQTAVTPTTGGNYDWTHQGDGIYTIEIPASGGASINNDTEGFGWFSGVATGVLPWRGPMIGFRAAGLNDALIDSAYSATRGLAGTALPNAAADAAGGLPISDAGGLDLDARLDAAVSSRLAPTTAGRTLDVTATGAAGIDWGNLENPTTAVNLSATNIDTDQVVASVTGAVGSVTGGVTVTTNNDKTGYALSSAGVQAIWDALTSALTAVGSVGKLIVDYLDAAISSRASQTSVDTVDGIVDAILVDTGTDIPARFTGVEGATFDTSTDSLEAIRNRGDAAWTTGAGGANPAVLQNTTIATLASQTSFTLTAGSADNDAYNGHLIVVTDQTTAEQKAVGVVLDYVGSTKTVTLAADPAIFTMAVGDEVDVLVGKANMVAIDGALTSGNNATLNLAQLNIVNSGGSAIVASSTGGNGHGINASGNGTGHGFNATGGATGNGIDANGGATSGNGIDTRGTAGNGHGVRAVAQGSGRGISAEGASSGPGFYAAGGANAPGISAQGGPGGSSGNGIRAVGDGSAAGIAAVGPSGAAGLLAQGTGSGNGIEATGGATGNGIHARGGATSGDGINAAAQTSGDGMELAGAGGGLDLNATTTDSLAVNVTQISGDSTAADNMEADYDGTGYNKSASTIGTATALSSTERNNIADALLKRDWTAVTGEAARSVLNALRFVRNKWSISGTTLTVTKEDDSTSAWTATVTTDAAADPVTGSDPT